MVKILIGEESVGSQNPSTSHLLFLVRHPLPEFELGTVHSDWFWTNALDCLAMIPASTLFYLILHLPQKAISRKVPKFALKYQDE